MSPVHGGIILVFLLFRHSCCENWGSVRGLGEREGRETGVMIYSYCAGEDGYTMFTRFFHPFSPPAVVGVQFGCAHITVGTPN
eukprot:8289610-Pyramimonas_sp.AAC.1